MLIILNEYDKLHNPEDYDQVVKAEIPCMIHGPLRVQNPRSLCTKNGKVHSIHRKRKYLPTYL